MEVSAHSLFLLQQLNVQREFGFLCDCTVAIGNVYFKAHRAVLAAFSNYFKMIFIHQSSECIKIQPTDIQPDVFSYLLHIMYTGMCPKQPVDQSRLQEGIKFLHAYQLCRQPGEGANDSNQDLVRMSNLYGIQISSQLASKEGSAGGAQKGSAGGRRGSGAPAGGDGRSSSHVGRSHAQLSSLAVGLEGLEGLVAADQRASGLQNVASGDDSDISSRIKQEQVEEGEEEEEGEGEEAQRGGGSPASPRGSSPCGGGLLFKDSPLPMLCPRCGECCSSPEGLREHLFNHAADGLIQAGASGLMERLTPTGGGGEAGGVGGDAEEEHRGGEVGGGGSTVDTGCLEEALRQSQALANQLAAELKCSQGGGGGSGGLGGGGGGSSPPSLPSATSLLHSRKRKMACAVCSVNFSHKSALQEHMYTHTTGKPSRYHRYNRLCSQLLHHHHASSHFCEGGGATPQGAVAMLEEANRDAQDNGSSCYSLDSEVSQESVDGVAVE